MNGSSASASGGVRPRLRSAYWIERVMPSLGSVSVPSRSKSTALPARDASIGALRSTRGLGDLDHALERAPRVARDLRACPARRAARARR